MNLSEYFDPISESFFNTRYPNNAFVTSIQVHTENFPDLRGLQIALIGLTEKRGIPSNESVERAVLEIREKLYNLKKGDGIYKVADLGNLKNGEAYEDTIRAIKEVGHYLMSQQILPVFFGGSHDLDLGQYLAYENLEKLVSVVTIDAKIDMEDEGPKADSHSQSIILHHPNYLFNYSHLAYQSFLVDKDLTNALEKLNFEHIRLGLLKGSLREVEPVVRNADLVSFDICAIQSSDAPGAYEAQPFGLSGEEACQLCRFAGLNEKLSSFGIYGYQPYYDDARNKTAAIVATMIWYFIDGFYERRDSLSFTGNDYFKYTVSFDQSPSFIVFYKSKRSEKWWMEVPYHTENKFDRNHIVPCSYLDYQTAQKGEIPERWVNAQLKLY
ncbi:formimidoylglutamase [Mongoliitalea daihaiensis]|uniref:formimidoylglutamase n=1 Tax=Mongoliitalea daihaiensis TaxID=2782006 RepID=UPI001F32494C|nr:formimidoylglutamase [Mongoliitalea daihaiensis]UJP66083.1 formimidoylglutamase [Mongoliitalea daihaiensis]